MVLCRAKVRQSAGRLAKSAYCIRMQTGDDILSMTTGKRAGDPGWPMQLKKYFWPAIGFGAVIFSAWLLYHELRGLSLDELWDSIVAISKPNWLLCIAA